MNKILSKSIHTLAAVVIATGGMLAQASAGTLPPPPPPNSLPPKPPLPPPPTTPPTVPPKTPPTVPPTTPPTVPPTTPPTVPPTNPPTVPPTNPPTVPPTNPPHVPPTTPPTTPPPAAARFGGPIAGLTSEQRDAFDDGLLDFTERETVATGLGPIFNNVSCVACHRGPAVGGSSRIFVTRFGRTTNGVFDPLASLGGSLLQQNGIAPGVREHIPREANTIAHRQTTPLFGLGLIEAIPDDTLIQLAQRATVDGVTGHAAMVTDVASGETRVGRFGWKNQQATLLAFSGDAYLNEMGITNRLFPIENAPNGNTALLAKFDTVPDIEDHADPVTGKSGIDALADFQRFLAPPPQLPLTARGIIGRDQFNQIGCAICHVPQLQTGASPVAALDHQTVNLYSDLLLHDMGKLGDGIAQADAGPNEFRTPPLWGLRASAPYLHDGRAVTVDAAIRAHEGQGKLSRDRYQALAPADRAALLEFLSSL